MKKIIFTAFLLFSLNFYSQNFFDENLKESVRTELATELLELTGVKIEDSNINIGHQQIEHLDLLLHIIKNKNRDDKIDTLKKSNIIN